MPRIPAPSSENWPRWACLVRSVDGRMTWTVTVAGDDARGGRGEGGTGHGRGIRSVARSDRRRRARRNWRLRRLPSAVGSIPSNERDRERSLRGRGGSWRARRDSNPRHSVPKTDALSAELRARGGRRNPSPCTRSPERPTDGRLRGGVPRPAAAHSAGAFATFRRRAAVGSARSASLSPGSPLPLRSRSPSPRRRRGAPFASTSLSDQVGSGEVTGTEHSPAVAAAPTLAPAALGDAALGETRPAYLVGPIERRRAEPGAYLPSRPGPHLSTPSPATPGRWRTPA